MNTIQYFIKSLKTLQLLMCFIAIAMGTQAQVNKGDYFFEIFEYGAALEAYEYAYNGQHVQNPFLSRKMALTHRMLGNMEQSKVWYERTLHRDQSNPQDMLYYAEALKYVGEYKEAIRWYIKYNNQVPEDRRALNHIFDREYVDKLVYDSMFYDVKKMKMSSEMPEFGITKFKEDYLVSYVGVVNPEMGKKTTDVNGRDLYMDVFVFERQEDNELILDDWLDGGVNSDFHDGPVCFDEVNNEMFITRNNVRKGKPVLDDQGKVNLKLFYSSLIDGRFQEAVELPFNSKDFSNAHPAISNDGKTLYFASNRPGGLGETDIYSSTRTAEGWTDPVNLGVSINTEGEETFPYVDEQGNLYFCSTGHAGLGGLDIFRTSIENGVWKKPENLGAPINSRKDDFGILMDSEGESGYFSSNRASQTIDDDLFYFQYDPTVAINGQVQDAGNLEAFDDAVVRLFAEDGSLVFETQTDENGEYQLRFIPKKCLYKLVVSKGIEYSEHTEEIDLCTKHLDEYNLGVHMIGRLTYMAEGVATHKETDEPVSGYIVTLIDRDSKKEIGKKTTLSDGKILFNLSPEKDYQMSFEKEGWFSRTAEFSTRGMEPGVLQIEEYVSLAFEEIVVEKAIEIENIYYDYNKFYVREDAKPELDKVVKMMEDNPGITIELSSHTDSRGGDKYNMELSKQRAKAAVAYIVDKGVHASRIQSKGYGETLLKNRCANNVQCSEEEHEQNRRTEFKVLSIR